MTEQEIAQVRGRLTPGVKPRRKRLAQMSVMLDKDETRALDAIAAEDGRSRSDLIREAVRKVWLRKGRRQ